MTLFGVWGKKGGRRDRRERGGRDEEEGKIMENGTNREKLYHC